MSHSTPATLLQMAAGIACVVLDTRPARATSRSGSIRIMDSRKIGKAERKLNGLFEMGNDQTRPLYRLPSPNVRKAHPRYTPGQLSARER